MRLTDVLASLGHPLAYYPALNRVTGSINATLLLCQIAYWTGKGEAGEGWVWKTAGDLERETGLTRREQETARKALRGRGLLQEERRGLPALLYYRLDGDAIQAAWDAQSAAIAPIKDGGGRQPLCASNANTDVRQTPTTMHAKRQPFKGAETTTETTTETTAAAAAAPAPAVPDGEAERATAGILRGLAAVWQTETGQAARPAQLRKLMSYEDAAQMSGLAELVPRCIRAAAERGKGWDYFAAMVERCLGDGEYPDEGRRPRGEGGRAGNGRRDLEGKYAGLVRR